MQPFAVARTTTRSSAPVLIDPLTGLLNHRGFQERVRAALAEATRTGGDLSLAIIDVDDFRTINESAGHHAGDRVLTGVADRLLRFMRVTDALGRIGGDQFGLMLPGCRGADALAVIDRARAAISATPFPGGLSTTVSAGVADVTDSSDAERLFGLASGALSWSKARGRDAACIYDPRALPDPPARDWALRIERSHALAGIRALARAIDAKDPSTRQHSDRVAVLARGLAETLEWRPDRVTLIEEAALVHDVGKIGVPDAVLLKPGPLDADEYEQIKQHAARGAEIVSEVLAPEQVEWIRAHHERPDGRGYPNRLTAGEISDGAAILAVADAFDVMTMPRAYSRAKPLDEALAECRALIGRQFLAEPVNALIAMLSAAPPDNGSPERRHADRAARLTDA
jgi:diguanylate cyclase (GGDEF)-like protein/putative nucleotidyltransferase with HDIG domain